MPVRLIAVLFAATVGVCAAQVRAAPRQLAPIEVLGYQVRDLLDTDLPLQRRRTALEKFTRDADGGDADAEYVVGSLYHAGERLPGALVARDDDKARHYLRAAAEHGSLNAMLKLAEIELGENHYREAMVWAQICMHYSLTLISSNDAGAVLPGEVHLPFPFDRYMPALLARIEPKLDAQQNALVQEDLRRFVADHDLTVTAGFSTMRRESDDIGLHLDSLYFHFASPLEETAAFGRRVMADYVVAVDKQGRIRRAWLLDALPDFQLGKALGWSASHVPYRSERPGDDTSLRFMLETLLKKGPGNEP